jgi:hypothetical protein
MNGSGDGDCAPPPSHTTGRAVFRIRRLNAAALSSGRKIRGNGPQMLVHRFRSEVSRGLRLGFAAWDPPRFHRFCPLRSIRVATAVVAPSDFRTLSTWTPVASLAPLLRSSALRSSGVTRLLRYYGLC